MRQHLLRVLSGNIEYSLSTHSIRHFAMPARIPLDNRSSSIPDSEPERVAIRLKAAQSSRLPSNMQVIEVSDSEPELNTPSSECYSIVVVVREKR